MIRTCPTCGDFYADPSPDFCAADGTPLVGVNPSDEVARVVEEKAKALKTRQRRLKWRRFMWSAVTTLVITLVVCVLVVNVYIYLGPKRTEVALAPSSTPTPLPTPTATPSHTPTPSPSATPSPTPSPTPVYIISGRVTVGDNSLVGVNVTLEGAKSSSTKTDSRGRYSFAGLPEGGSYTVTPDGARTNFTPRSHPVKNLSRDVSVDFAGAAPPECTFADEATEERNIKKKFAADWLKLIKGEREKISAEHTPPRDSNVNRGTPPSDNPLIFTPENRGARPSPLRRAPVLRSSARRVEPLHYDIRFPRMCRASVTVTYNVNGRPEALPVLRVECNKVGDDWRCGKNLTR